MSNSFYVKSRSGDYEVIFIDDFAGHFLSQKEDDTFLLIDEKIQEMYSEKISNVFSQEKVFTIQANEDSKTLFKCKDLIQYLIDSGVRKNSVLVAVGGGVVEDIAGFVSTILFRGISWVYYPTTLLAQADSCIGSKSSINFEGYKNLLGSFYPPSVVAIDTSFLNTLPEDQIKSGIGEILHYYILAGQEDLARKMMGEYQSLIDSPRKLKQYILPSLDIKKTVIERDELDKGERNIFNYGHTFGHAIETVTSYEINHGQAVTMGMDIANFISMKKGYLDENVFNRIHKILSKNMPDFKLTEANAEAYYKALSKDKKNIGSNLGCILTRGSGDMFKEQLPMDDTFKEYVISYFASDL